jgi:hypothetical protein
MERWLQGCRLDFNGALTQFAADAQPLGGKASPTAGARQACLSTPFRKCRKVTEMKRFNFSGGTPFRESYSFDWQACGMRWGSAHIEFQHARHHDHRLRLIPVFEQCEPERFGAVDEQPAAQMILVLHNPMALTVLANKEQGRLHARR